MAHGAAMTSRTCSAGSSSIWSTSNTGRYALTLSSCCAPSACFGRIRLPIDWRRPELLASMPLRGGSAKFEYELIRPPSHQRIEHNSTVVIGSIGEPIILRLEHEARRLDFLPQRHWVNPVQRFGVAQARTRGRGVVDDGENSARLECFEKRRVQHLEVGRAHESIVQIVVVLRRPQDVKALRRGESIYGAAHQGHVGVVRIALEGPRSRHLSRRAVPRLLIGDERVHLARGPDHFAQETSEVSIAWHEIRHSIAGLDARKG